jgi:hypothetical protein
MVRRSANLFLLFSIGISSLACEGSHDAKVTENAIRQFHSQFNAEKYSEIYREAHPFYRKQLNEQLFINKLKELRERVGEFSETAKINQNCFIRSSVLTFVGTEGLNDVKVLCVISGSKGTATEEFVWQVSSDSETATFYDYKAGQIFKTK